MRLFALAALLNAGCAYKVGSGVVRGALDELGGEGASVNEVGEQVLERALLAELGHQLGQGLRAGATDITPEQQADLERVIDQLLTTAARKTGKGLRDDVSPEFRNLVRRDIVGALAEGVRGELAPTLEETVDRVIERASRSLRVALQDENLRVAVGDLLRDSVFAAIEEGQAGTPPITETLTMMTQQMVRPIEEASDRMSDRWVGPVQQASQETQRVLYGVISVLTLGVIAALIAYALRSVQLQRAREASLAAEEGLRRMDAALTALDEGTREDLRRKLGDLASRPVERGDDYQR